MTFVNELIPEEDKKTRFDPKFFHRLNNPWKEPINILRWTVDRDKDVFLVYLGTRGPEQPSSFVMSVQGHIVHVEAFGNSVWDSISSTKSVTWTIDRLLIPVELDAQRDAVIQLLVESINVMGAPLRGREGSQISSVTVDLGQYK